MEKQNQVQDDSDIYLWWSIVVAFQQVQILMQYLL